MTDALRLAFGTLTVLPVLPPSQVDRRTAGRAMALAPLVGGLLGAVVALGAWLLREHVGRSLLAVLLVTAVAFATRLIHWDGLADTADGLGSGRPAGAALDVMRRSDIGPFGVFAVVAVFAFQVAGLSEVLAASRFVGATVGGGPDAAPGAALGAAEAVLGRTGLGAVVAALVLGRCALLVACRSGVPAARPDGLGAGVAGSVGRVQLTAGAAGAALVLWAAVLVDPALGWVSMLLATGVSVAWAVAATAYLRRRLGGMTGDTLGALVETSTAVALVVLAVG